MSEPDEDEMTEIYDADIPRVDLVGKAANGVPGFLLMKQDASGLLPAEFVRDLISKASPEAAPAVVRDDITMSGSPAAMAEMIHKAAQRATGGPIPDRMNFERDEPELLIVKAEKSTASINDLPDSDFAYIEPGGTKDDTGKTTPRSLRHFPIMDAAHTRNALSRAPQSPFGDKALPKIKAAAKKFGIDVSKENPMNSPAETVTKDGAELDLTVEDLIAATPAGSTAESVPGSPDWENLDGDTALTVLAVLGRVKAVIEWLANREATEAVTGESGDEYDVFELDDAACAVDCAIDTLASFAAGEKLEADLADELEAVGKAAADAVAPLTALEGFAPLVKAGRVLSSANETLLRSATESLEKVLASLPAPTPDDGQPVAKEKTMTEALTAIADAGNTGTDALDVLNEAAEGAAVENAELTEPTDELSKAKSDGMQIVYDAEGNAVGLIDPTKVQPIADGTTNGDAAESTDAPDSTVPAPSAAEGIPADAADATPPVAAPAPPTAAPVADDVAKSDPELDPQIAALVKAALDEQSAAQASIVKALEDRIAYLEAPADPKTITKGAVPTHLRGQDQGGTAGTPDEVADLRKQISDSADVSGSEQARNRLNELAIAELARLRQRPQTR